MLSRKQTDATKAKISQTMKQVHAQKTETEKMLFWKKMGLIMFIS